MLRLSKKIDKYLERNYKKLDKNTFIIEVDLDRYTEVFNEWDKGAARRRNIDPELENFLNDCSSDIPLKYNIAFYLYLPAHVKNTEYENTITAGIHNYFNFCLLNIAKEKKNFMKKTLKYFLLSLFFLFTATILKIKVADQVMVETLTEVLFIGGWVFMWETFSNLFIARDDLLKEEKEYERFLKAEILYKYEKRT